MKAQAVGSDLAGGAAGDAEEARFELNLKVSRREEGDALGREASVCEALVYPGEQGESKVVGEDGTRRGHSGRQGLSELPATVKILVFIPRAAGFESFPFIAPPSVIIAHLSSLSLHHLGRPSWADS